MVYARSNLAKQFHGIANAGMLITCVCALILVTIFTIGIPFWSPKLLGYYNLTGLLVMAITVIGIAISSLQDYLFLAKKSLPVIVLRSFVTVSLRVVVLFFLVPFLGPTGATLAFASGSWVVILSGALILRKRVETGKRLDFKNLRKLAGYSRDTYLISLFSLISANSLPLIVLNSLGSKNAGYFYVAWTLANILFILPGATSTAVFIENVTNPTVLAQQSLQAIRLSIGGAILAGVGVLIVSPFILGTFGVDYVYQATVPLYPLLLSSLPMAFYNIGQSKLRAQGRMKPLVIISTLVTLVTLIGGAIGVQVFGLLGIGLAWLVGQIIGALLWFLPDTKNMGRLVQ